MEAAQGGILFIDEAHGLAAERGSFAAEALQKLVSMMTEDQYAGTIIIIAGYAKEMNHMLSKDQGLRSRFKVNIYI